MKYRWTAFLLFLLAMLTFSGCACEHEWVAADCVNPQICAKCNESGEPALGHDWLDATCIAPKTCSRCAATEGGPLGHDWLDATCTAPETCAHCSETQGENLAHAYDEWSFTDALMAHTCSVCNYFEELPIDYQLYLESLLVGYWDCWSVYYPDGPDFDGYEKIWGVEGDLYSATAYLWSYEGSACLQFNADKTFALTSRNIFTGDHDNLTGSWAILESESDCEIPSSIGLWLTNDFFGDNILNIDCIFSDDGELMLKFDLTKNGNHPTEWAMTFYREQDEMLAGFCGNWGVVTNTYTDKSYCLQIRPDRTATCYIEGIYEGTWSLGANPLDRSYVKFNIEYVKDGKSEMFTGYYNTPNEYHDVPTLSLSDSNRDFNFHEVSDEELAIRQGATDLFSGTWTSIGFGSSNPKFADSVTNDYSLTVEKNGGFTLMVPDGITYDGTWSAYATHEGYWQYYLYFTEQKKQVYCFLDTRGSVATVGIGETTDGELFLKQMR